jgi:ParB family chromosome partitioning protein
VTETLPIADVVIGSRVRREVLHLELLASSLRDIGMLHPVVLNSRNELIAGFRRLKAAEECGWSDVPVRRIDTMDDALSALKAEYDENICRQQLSPSEVVELGRKIEELEKPKAKERQAKAGPTGGKGAKATGSGKLPEPVKGDTRDKVASSLGVSGRTYEKAKQVVEAAKQEPEVFGDLPEKMDAGSVDAAHKELKARRQSQDEPEAEPADDSEDVVESCLELVRSSGDPVGVARRLMAELQRMAAA